MKRDWSLRRTSVGLLLSATVSLLLVPCAGAQSKYKSLYRFHGWQGVAPAGGLIFDGAGNLYGTTESGGVHFSAGTIFELTPSAGGGWTEKVLYNFCTVGCTDGIQPQASLIFDTAGNLYGTARFGGNCDSGCGTVFELTPNSGGNWTLKVLYSFTGAQDGNEPLAGLTFDAAGNLYGTTITGGNTACNPPYGCGVVFQLKPNSSGGWTESVLHSFTGSDGEFPVGGVTFDAVGNLYGTTGGHEGIERCNGRLSCSTVFELKPASGGGWKESVLYRFCSLGNCADGRSPRGSLTFDSAGNLYGTTAEGGVLMQSCNSGNGSGCGTVFELKPASGGGWKESVLYRFCSLGNCADGEAPYASLTFDSAGNLYGTTSGGGDAKAQAGEVFELTRNSKGGWGERVLHRFLNHPGYAPMAGVIFDRAGNLYGTTFGDSSSTSGSVFEITP